MGLNFHGLQVFVSFMLYCRSCRVSTLIAKAPCTFQWNETMRMVADPRKQRKFNLQKLNRIIVIQFIIVRIQYILWSQ